MAVTSPVMAEKCAAPVSLVVRPQSTTPARDQARMLMSTRIAAVTGTVYFSKVRIR